LHLVDTVLDYSKVLCAIYRTFRHNGYVRYLTHTYLLSLKIVIEQSKYEYFNFSNEKAYFWLQYKLIKRPARYQNRLLSISYVRRRCAALSEWWSVQPWWMYSSYVWMLTLIDAVRLLRKLLSLNFSDDPHLVRGIVLPIFAKTEYKCNFTYKPLMTSAFWNGYKN
jgi:hypothetical protein